MEREAYGYLRVSSPGQLKGFGVDRQEDTIKEFADRESIHIKDWYKEAYTGTSEDRPAFMEMLQRIMENGVRIVICECLDRLARDLMIQTVLLAKLELEHITLYSALTGEDVTECMREDPMRRAMVQIQGVFAELDKNLTIRKLRKGRQSKREKTGRCEGQLRFGEYAEEEACWKVMQELGEQQLDHGSIANLLNAKGFRNRQGNLWSGYGVKRIFATRKVFSG